MKQEKPFQSGWSLFLGGICMGAADLIPGISGGTVAFILGFYFPLLQSLKTFNRQALSYLFNGEWRKLAIHVNWQFLLILGSGILCAMVTLVHPFNAILKDPKLRIYLYSIFFGLILASFYFCMRQLKTWSAKYVIYFFVGAGISFLLTGSTLNYSSSQGFTVAIEPSQRVLLTDKNIALPSSLSNLTVNDLNYLVKQQFVGLEAHVYNSQGEVVGVVKDMMQFYQEQWLDVKMIGCGSLAICALLLPGISGSYILTLLGVYPIVIEAFADFIAQATHLHFDMHAFKILFNLSLGIFIGILSFARLLSYLMHHYADVSLSLLSGFMIGALRSVWPFWSYEFVWMPLKMSKGPQLLPAYPIFPMQDLQILVLAFSCSAMGFSLIWLFEKMAEKKVQTAN